jgi:hypothetical protein
MKASCLEAIELDLAYLVFESQPLVLAWSDSINSIFDDKHIVSCSAFLQYHSLSFANGHQYNNRA